MLGSSSVAARLTSSSVVVLVVSVVVWSTCSSVWCVRARLLVDVLVGVWCSSLLVGVVGGGHGCGVRVVVGVWRRGACGGGWVVVWCWSVCAAPWWACRGAVVVGRSARRRTPRETSACTRTGGAVTLCPRARRREATPIPIGVAMNDVYVQCGACSADAEIGCRVVDDRVTEVDLGSVPAGWSVTVRHGELEALCNACRVVVGARCAQLYRGRVVRRVVVLAVDGPTVTVEALNGPIRGTRYTVDASTLVVDRSVLHADRIG